MASWKSSCLLDETEDPTSQVTIDVALSDIVEFPGKGLLAMLQSEKHSDLSFIVEDKVVRVHRVVMASQSSYFDSLLYGPMKESKSQQIKLHDTPWSAFQLILQYIYSGCITTSASVQTVLDLLVLADRYEFPSLMKSLERLLCSHMDMSNVLQLMSYADMYGASVLLQQCTQYVDGNASLVLQSQSLLLIPKERLKALLCRDTFFASEVDIFEAVMRWKEFNGMEVSEIGDVLQCVRLAELSTAELRGVVAPSGMYSEEIIEGALKQTQSPSSYIRQPRGKLGVNLFDNRSTSLSDCTNFRVSIEPKMFGKIDVVLPRHQEFTLMSNPTDVVYSTITFKFDDVYVINQVTFGGWPTVWEDSGTYETGTPDWAYEHEIRNPYMYVLEVSKDGVNWSAVIDHSICKCYCIQDLFFPRHAVRYLRLNMTKAHEYLKIKFISCSLSDCDLPFQFYPGGSIAPIQEMTPQYITNWGTSSGGKTRCMLTFHQPYHISQVKFVVEGMQKNPDNFGQVLISVALYNKARSYKEVGNVQHNFSEELMVNFSARLVSIVSIHFANYYNSKTGQDRSKLLLDNDIEVAKFKILCLI